MPAIKSLAMPFGDLRRKLDQSVVYDWAMRCLIMIYCSFLLCRDVVQFCQQVAHDPVAFEQFDAGTYVAMLARISRAAFVVVSMVAVPGGDRIAAAYSITQSVSSLISNTMLTTSSEGRLIGGLADRFNSAEISHC
jgi:Na+-driven multidrug efflux pump